MNSDSTQTIVLSLTWSVKHTFSTSPHCCAAWVPAVLDTISHFLNPAACYYLLLQVNDQCLLHRNLNTTCSQSLSKSAAAAAKPTAGCLREICRVALSLVPSIRSDRVRFVIYLFIFSFSAAAGGGFFWGHLLPTCVHLCSSLFHVTDTGLTFQSAADDCKPVKSCLVLFCRSKITGI